MANRTDVARGRDIVARWCSLAEQRLDHLTELYETGRWKRFHSEQAFLENVREARAAVETWRNLLTREASLENLPIDFSWIGRPWSTTAVPRVRFAAKSTKTQPVQAAMAPAPAKEIAVKEKAVVNEDVLATMASEIVAASEAPVGLEELSPALHGSATETPFFHARIADIQALETQAPEASSDELPLPVLDLTAIQQRYPLLRNAL